MLLKGAVSDLLMEKIQPLYLLLACLILSRISSFQEKMASLANTRQYLEKERFGSSSIYCIRLS